MSVIRKISLIALCCLFIPGFSALAGESGKIGGDKFVQFNAEIILPLPVLHKAGMVGVLFYDTGDVFDKENIGVGNLRQSAGYGIRWLSPIGPIRLENGYVLDPKEGESGGGRWEFTMGAAF